MAVYQFGKESWDLVDGEGEEVHFPPDKRPAVDFPRQWRVFGPVGAETTKTRWAGLWNSPGFSVGVQAEPLVSAAVEGLSSVPETLTVGDQTLEGRDVVLSDDTLDFGVLFGGYGEGQQAYAMAVLELTQPTKVIIGAGADWWMQWWIDGEPVFDTLALGNRSAPITHADHCFSRKLEAGRHLLTVRVISGSASWVLRAGWATGREEILSRLTSSPRWEFIPETGEMRPSQATPWTHTMAIRSDLCLAEETIECEYQQDHDSGNVGIVFGALDSGHYYWAQVPHWGQLWRARGFWAAISVADGSGYIRNLKMELMPNVVCHINAWRRLKVERRGNRIQMWVNGVKGPCVVDDTYGAGRPGIGGFSKYQVRNLKIDGKPVAGPPWPGGDQRGQPWFNPVPELSLGDFQGPGPLCRLGQNEIVLTVLMGRDSSCHHLNDDNSALYFYRSEDNGRNWSRYGGPLPPSKRPQGPCFALRPGVIRSVTFDEAGRRFLLRDSTDKGLTWSEPFKGKLLGDWRRDIFRRKTWNGLYWCTRLDDGTLLAVILHGYHGLYDSIPNEGQGTWGTGIAQPYCTLSRDQGLTWSEPVPMDNAAARDGEAPDSPCGGFSETPVAQLPSGRLVALARPFRSPFMWQTESEDGGRSWRMACYAPFSGAGGPQLVATRSGYLAIIKRGPGLGLHMSIDGGVNWDQGTMIDFPSSFNGSVMEVEPDVLLVVYPQSMDEIRPSLFRAQRIRLTPQGPVPLGNK